MPTKFAFAVMAETGGSSREELRRLKRWLELVGSEDGTAEDRATLKAELKGVLTEIRELSDDIEVILGGF